VISYLVINTALFLSMVFIIHYYICKKTVSRDSSIKNRLNLGFSYGCASGVLMFFRYQLEFGVVDLRHLPILLASFYGGWASAIAAFIVASAGRLFLTNQLGDYTIPVLILTFDAMIAVIVPHMVRSRHLKWIVTLIVDVGIVPLILSQGLRVNRFEFWLVFAGIAFVGGSVAYHLTESLRKSQQTLCELKDSRIHLENTVEHLDEIKEQLESFIRHSADAIVILDIEEKVVKVNPAFEMMFGWNANEVTGIKPLPWIPIDQQEEASELRWSTMRDMRLYGYEKMRRFSQ
jgi:PAS domain-containing protein